MDMNVGTARRPLTPQMAGFLPPSARTQFGDSAAIGAIIPPLSPSKPSAPTPYTALLVQPQMREPIFEIVRALYGDMDARLIPLCHFGDGLEPVVKTQQVKILASIDNHRGLQVLIAEVDGQRFRKDGCPYHAIWSASKGADEGLVRDEGYRWPVNEITHAWYETDDAGRKRYQFNVVSRQKPYPRVLSAIEMEAEDLARRAVAANPDCEWLMSDDMDCLPVNIWLEIRPPDARRAYGTIHPELVRVDSEDGRRHVSRLPDPAF